MFYWLFMACDEMQKRDFNYRLLTLQYENP